MILNTVRNKQLNEQQKINEAMENTKVYVHNLIDNHFNKTNDQ